MWAKLFAAMTAIAGVLFIRNKLQAHEIENLEEANEAHTIKDEIQESIKEVEIQAEEVELEQTKDINNDDWRSNI